MLWVFYCKWDFLSNLWYNNIKNEGDSMNQKFEYYIKKILNKVLLQLIAFILLTALLILLATITRFKIASYPMPLLYVFIGCLLLVGVAINYISYRRNIWLLKHYQEDEEDVIERIRRYKNDVKSNTNRITLYLFTLFNKKSFVHYDEAINALNKAKGKVD